MLYLLVAIVALVFLCYGIGVFRNRHPLTRDEVIQLAQKRRRKRALLEYQFCSKQLAADVAEKKAMKSVGEFLACDLDYNRTPSRIAGLLKYKKHEWIVFAFISVPRVTRLWWNKGPDGKQVWPFLQSRELDKAIESLNPDALAILHNHPNPDPLRYRMNIQSDADLASAGFLHRRLARRRISLLEFICERGVPHLYYAAFSDVVVPVAPILGEVDSVNGTGIFKNYRLRKEMRKRTQAEQIYGASHG